MLVFTPVPVLETMCPHQYPHFQPILLSIFVFSFSQYQQHLYAFAQSYNIS